MRRAIITAVLLLISGVAIAAPNQNLSATAPTQYADGTFIPANDLTYNVYCSGQDNGVYEFLFDAQGLTDPGGVTIDISACVQGQVGTYYFVATAISSQYNTESAYSNETTKTYTASDLGKVPNAPTLLTIAMLASDFVFSVS